jgi:hypothetical protein
MEIEPEEIMELNRLGEAINTREQVSILNLLYEDDECTIHQVCNALDMPEEKAEKYLAKLEELIWVSGREIMAHPLVNEKAYWLTSRGRRYVSALNAIIEREIDLGKSVLEV